MPFFFNHKLKLFTKIQPYIKLTARNSKSSSSNSSLITPLAANSSDTLLK